MRGARALACWGHTRVNVFSRAHTRVNFPAVNSVENLSTALGHKLLTQHPADGRGIRRQTARLFAYDLRSIRRHYYRADMHHSPIVNDSVRSNRNLAATAQRCEHLPLSRD